MNKVITFMKDSEEEKDVDMSGVLMLIFGYEASLTRE
jgi:hypothetical protein